MVALIHVSDNVLEFTVIEHAHVHMLYGEYLQEMPRDRESQSC